MLKGITAIVLAAGKGKRMNSKVQKQYMTLKGKPLLYYALEAFEKSKADQVILVVGKGEVQECYRNIVMKFGFQKVVKIEEGGKERYDSVYSGLREAEGSDYVLIHDGARPCLTPELIDRMIEEVIINSACVAAVPVKDTIKLVDDSLFALSTPDRSHLWMVQTPQAFEYRIIWDAYTRMMSLKKLPVLITDDAMVLEHITDKKVKMIMGSYSNIKVTTPEDMVLAEAFL